MTSPGSCCWVVISSAGLPLSRPVWDRVWIYGCVSEYADRIICAIPNFPSAAACLCVASGFRIQHSVSPMASYVGGLCWHWLHKQKIDVFALPYIGIEVKNWTQISETKYLFVHSRRAFVSFTQLHTLNLASPGTRPLRSRVMHPRGFSLVCSSRADSFRWF